MNFLPKLFIGGTVRNSAEFLPLVYQNIKEIVGNTPDYRIIFFYDRSNDKTLEFLRNIERHDPNIIVIENKNKLHASRTARLAYGRNTIIEKIKELNKSLNWKFFIKMDMDDVCASTLNIKTLTSIFKKKNINLWDSISFNKSFYYDSWAVSTPDIFLSCWNFEDKSVTEFINKYMEKNLKINKYLKVLSAFNGFAVYKIPIFLKSHYASKVGDTLPFFTQEEIRKNERLVNSNFKINNLDEEDCEHRYFHCYAHYNFGAKIIVCNKYLFN